MTNRLAGARPGHEVPLFVEHRVIGQVALVVNAPHFPACAHGGGVVEVDAFIDKTHDGNATLRSLGHLAQRNLVVGHKARFEEQVFRWVARDGQLREHREVGTALFGAAKGVDDHLDVAAEVTDNGVQLTEGDAQPRHESRA